MKYELQSGASLSTKRAGKRGCPTSVATAMTTSTSTFGCVAPLVISQDEHVVSLDDSHMEDAVSVEGSIDDDDDDSSPPKTSKRQRQHVPSNLQQRTNKNGRQEWWKQTPAPSYLQSCEIMDENKSRCIVCQSIFYSDSSVEAPHGSGRNYNHESIVLETTTTAAPSHHQPTLFQFFSPTNSSPLTAATRRRRTCNALPATATTTTSAATAHGGCAYCERPACPNCRVDCERCGHSFCTFCTQQDYHHTVSSYAQTLCRDCGASSHQPKDETDTDTNADAPPVQNSSHNAIEQELYSARREYDIMEE